MYLVCSKDDEHEGADGKEAADGEDPHVTVWGGKGHVQYYFLICPRRCVVVCRSVIHLIVYICRLFFSSEKIL